MTFWVFLGPLAIDLPQCGTNQYRPCFLVKTSPAEGRRRFHKNTACVRLGFWGFGFWGLGFRVQGKGFGVLWFRVQGLGFRVKGFEGFGVQVFRCSGV